MGIRLSLIIPTLNEEDTLPELLASLAPILPEIELVMVDGGSSDRTCEVAGRFADSLGNLVLLTTSAGRGRQIALGAEHARGNALLILHADSTASAAMLRELCAFLGRDPAVQRTYAPRLFRLRFDERSPLLRLYARLARIESITTSFGDQGLLIGRDVYRQIGPIMPLPLFEDVEFLRRARRHSTITLSEAEITTSARRFRKLGVIRTQLRNIWLMTCYLLGADIERLARNYRTRHSVEQTHMTGRTAEKRRIREKTTHPAASTLLSTTQNGEES